MASEIQWVHAATGSTLYAVIRTATGTVWNTAGTPNFEARTVANWTDYDVALAETPASSYFYVGTFPPIAGNMVAGWYWVDVYLQAGASPAIGDTLLGTLVGYWDGTSVESWASDVRQLGKVTQSATDLKDFADTGYDPSTHKVAGVVLADGCTLAATVTALSDVERTAIARQTANTFTAVFPNRATVANCSAAEQAASWAKASGTGTLLASNRSPLQGTQAVVLRSSADNSATVFSFTPPGGFAINSGIGLSLRSSNPDAFYTLRLRLYPEAAESGNYREFLADAIAPKLTDDWYTYWHSSWAETGTLPDWGTILSPTFPVEKITLELRAGAGQVMDLEVGGLWTNVLKLPVPLCLWFDDGWAEVYDAAYPMLAAADIKATLAINAGTIGTAGFMTWAQINELAAAGWDVVSHGTLNHEATIGISSTALISLLTANREELVANCPLAKPWIVAWPYNPGDTTSHNAQDVAESIGVLATRGKATRGGFDKYIPDSSFRYFIGLHSTDPRIWMAGGVADVSQTSWPLLQTSLELSLYRGSARHLYAHRLVETPGGDSDFTAIAQYQSMVDWIVEHRAIGHLIVPTASEFYELLQEYFAETVMQAIGLNLTVPVNYDTPGTATLLDRATEARLAELDAANLPSDVDDIIAGVNVTSISGSTLAAQALAARYYAYKNDAVVLVADAANDVDRGTALLAAMVTARALTPGGVAKSANNRAQVLVPPGRYDLVVGTTQGGNANTGLLLDTEFVDLISLTGDPDDVIIISQIAVESRGTVQQTANNVWIRGIKMDLNAVLAGNGETINSAYFPATNLPLTKLIDCKTRLSGSGGRGMRIGINYSGWYENVTHTGNYGFGNYGAAAGTFINCTHVGDNGFGYNGTATGTFIQCVGIGSNNWPTTPTGRYFNCLRGVVGGTAILDNVGAREANTTYVKGVDAAQAIRDAMKLAPTAGDPAAGSLDKHADDILADTDALPTASAIAAAVWGATASIATLIASIASSVWTVTNRTLTGITGGTGPDAATGVSDIYVIANKNDMERLVGKFYYNGSYITQAAIDSISYSAFLLDPSDVDSRTAIGGHQAVDVSVEDTVFDTLQTDQQATSFNFAHRPSITAYPLLSIAGQEYLLEYTFTPASGEPFIRRFVLRCK
jgi:hypothetical protein